MPEDTKKNQAKNEPAAELSDEQLEDTSGGVNYSDITLKRGYIANSDAWPVRTSSDSEQASLSETPELSKDD